MLLLVACNLIWTLILVAVLKWSSLLRNKMFRSLAIKGIRKAIDLGNVAVMKLILSKYQDLGDLALRYAAYRGNLNCMVEIEREYVVSPERAFISAAKGGRVDALEQLYHWGVNPSCYNLALMANIKHAGGANIETLRDMGANDCYAAMYVAAKNGDHRTMAYMKDWGANNFDKCMRATVKNGDIVGTQLLLDWGAANHDWGLCKAAATNDVYMMKLMRKVGPSCIDSALTRAMLNNNVEARELLLDWGATIRSCQKQ